MKQMHKYEYMAGFCLGQIDKSKAGYSVYVNSYTVASVQTVTGSVFMRRIR